MLSELFDKRTKKYRLNQVLPKKKGEKEPVKPEFGPTSSESYSDGSVQNTYTWTYTNVKGQEMDITINFDKQLGGRYPTLFISFGKVSTQDKWKVMTGAKDLNIILNTVIAAANKIIKKEVKNKKGLFAVGFEPADERRKNIYTYFIENNFKNFKRLSREEIDNEEGLQKIQKQKSYEWFRNDNYPRPGK